MISLSRVTVPTPQPYQKSDEGRQRENYYYVLNQIYNLAKADGDQDPFGVLAAIEASASAVQVDLDDLHIKVFGQAAIIESV